MGIDDNPFDRARKASLVRAATIAAGIVLFAGGSFAAYRLLHKPDYSERLDAYKEEFGAIADAAEAVRGPVAGSTKDVAGRKYLLVTMGVPSQELGDEKLDGMAAKASDVGLVISGDTTQDASDAVVYTDGSHGHGGKTTFRAVAWPEKRLVAELHMRCLASPVKYAFRGDKSEQPCLYDDDDLRAFIDDVRAGRVPRQHSKDPVLDAQFALDTRFAAMSADFAHVDAAKAPKAPPPDVTKVLVLVKGKPSQSLLPPRLAAQTPEEVDLVVLVTTQPDEKPSTHYGNGVYGYDGDVTMTAFTPKRELVGQSKTRCHAPADSSTLLGTRHCSASQQDLEDFVAALGTPPATDAGAEQ